MSPSLIVLLKPGITKVSTMLFAAIQTTDYISIFSPLFAVLPAAVVSSVSLGSSTKRLVVSSRSFWRMYAVPTHPKPFCAHSTLHPIAGNP